MTPRKRTVQVKEVALLCDSGQGSTYEYEDRGVCLSGDTAKAEITCTCEQNSYHRIHQDDWILQVRVALVVTWNHVSHVVVVVPFSPR